MQESTGDSAFVRMLTSHQRRIYLYINTFLPNGADAEDVLQATNTVLWSKREAFEEGTSFGAWAYRIAFFEVLAFRKRHGRQRMVFNSDLMQVMASEQEHDDSGAENRRHILHSCLAKLRPADRGLVGMRYDDGKTVDEMASLMSRPLKSVYRSLERIRMSLLECIQRTLSQGGEA